MNDQLIRIVFLAHFASSLYMVGLIWFVQVVHYPLFASVGRQEFPRYEQGHTALTTWVVAPPMLIEGATAVLLLWFRPPGVPKWSVWSGFALLGATWLSTALIQVPCHNLLSEAFDPEVHQRLVSTNWLRTAAWSLHGVLVLWMAWSSRGIGSPSTMTFESTNMARLEVGDQAPDFSATTHDGHEIRLEDFLGKRALVLFFYPKNGTPICTQEACAFRDSYEQFIDAGADVIGVSSDSEQSHQAFSKQHRLSFPLISDANGSLRMAFAVPKTMGVFPGRVTYVIDQAGIIRHIFSAQFASDEHVRQALAAVSAARRSS
jgi:peroxiredoxin Q/BCP